ncbi:MAG: hypothetical protein JWR84_3501 [Caulobacter sp.]|nr:hypothetical protein [Caulobacter sp.]
MRALIRTTLIVAALLLLPGSVALWPCKAAACSCSRWGDERLFMNSQLVVVGRLARNQTPTDEVSFWVTVERREKGHDGAKRLKVLLPIWNEWTDCGCGPRTPGKDDHKTYRFFLERSKDHPDAYLLFDTRRL